MNNNLQPQLETERLLLNAIQKSDTERLVAILNASEVYSKNTLNIPYPYEEKDAEFFYNLAQTVFENHTGIIFAIREKASQLLIGAIGLHDINTHQKAEVGYWIAEDYWGKGYAKEALKSVLHFGFEHLKLNKIYATHNTDNTKSGKVMVACGMKQEGFLEEEVYKQGKFMDVYRYAILKRDKNAI